MPSKSNPLMETDFISALGIWTRPSNDSQENDSNASIPAKTAAKTDDFFIL
jgi:hypothetical protein